MKTYVTKQNDMLDLICFRHYGGRQGVTERVLAYNFGLCTYPPVLPAGLTITLPDIPATSTPANTITLWDA